MRPCILMLAVAVGLEPGTSFASTPSTPVDAAQIAQLISQLGSAKFHERESATRALEAIGGPALEALQRAARSDDPEVGRRAQILAQAVRKRIETAEFLTPLLIRLVYKETPVPQAVDDFAKRTGFPIALASSRARLNNRKISLDTGETSFWEAFHQFCQKAGLVERTSPADSDLQTRHLLETTRLGPRGIGPIVELSSSTLSSVRGWDGRLTLAEGRPLPLPTYHAGAVRIRALPAKGTGADQARDDVLFVVEITPQPKAAWHNIVDLRIDKALDGNGQDLASAIDPRSDLSQLAALGNGVVLWDTQTGQPINACRDIPVHLKSGDKPAGVLQEVKGVVAAQVQTSPQALITVDNILKSTGHTFLGENGESLKVLEADRQANGDVHLRVELTDASSQNNTLWAMRGGVLRPNRRRAFAAMENMPPANLLLEDGSGQNFPARSHHEDMVINGNTLARAITVTYHCGSGEPRKLVYSGRRTIVIEIPFTLTNVPLP